MPRLVEQARVALQDWVRRYVSHPEIRTENPFPGFYVHRRGAHVTVHIYNCDSERFSGYLVPEWARPTNPVVFNEWRGTPGHYRINGDGSIQAWKLAYPDAACGMATYLARTP